MKKLSISGKITICITVVQVIVMLFVFLATTTGVVRVLTERAMSDMDVMAEDRAQILEQYIKRCTEYLDDFSHDEAVVNLLKNPNDKEAIKKAQAYVDIFAEGEKNIEGLYVASMETYTYVHNNPESINKTFREGAALIQLKDQLLAHDDAFCTGIAMAPVSQRYVIPSYKTVKDEKGEILGFVGCAFYTDAIADVLSTIQENNDSISYSLINVLTSEYIFSDKEDLVGGYCNDRNVISIISKLLAKDQNVDLRFSTHTKVASCYYMKDRNWLFVVTDNSSSVNSVLDNVKLNLAFIAILACVVLALLSIGGVKKLLKPLSSIEKNIGKLSNQDLSIDKDVEALKSRSDEIGSFARTVEMLREALENQNEIYSELLKVQSIGFMSLSFDTDEIILINKEALTMLGLSPNQTIDGKLEKLYSKLTEENASEIRQMVEALRNSKEEKTCECKIVKAGQPPIYALSHGKNVRLSTGKNVLVFSLTDITEKKELEENLLVLSETDALTGICNRRSGEKRIRSEISCGERGLYILFDVNKFKYVNDTYGHGVGDEVLVAIAKTMEKTFRASDIFVRLGGDEFVVYATEITSEQVAKSVIERFLANIGNINLESLNGYKISVSLGAVLCDESTVLNDCFEKADSIMYECKKEGGNAYRIYSDVTKL